MFRCLCTILGFACVIVNTGVAEIPQMINYQGQVTDGSGTPVADGSYTMRFRIYDDPTSGTLEWDSGDQSIQVAGGIFSVILGESPQPAINLGFEEDYWLLVRFNGVNQLPRQQLVSAGYAYMASGLVPGTEVIGSVTYGSYAAIKGVNTAISGSTYGGIFSNASTNGIGVYGYAYSTTGSNYGGWFESESTNGTAVLGLADAETGTNYGGWFASHSSDGIGAYGLASATSGLNSGVSGQSHSSNGRGVYGLASAGGSGVSYGGWFESISTNGRGVLGMASAGTGATYGVVGQTQSTTGIGVYGLANASTGACYGVYGITHSTSTDNAGSSAAGVYGLADGNGDYYWNLYGVLGEAVNGFGVGGRGEYGGGVFSDPGGNWAWIGMGAYKIEGTGLVSFVQNHPYDNNRVIVYAAPEGDEVATYTRGTARLKNGKARVSLGETFEWVTNPDIGLTAHLTPRDVAVPLAVISLTTKELVVQGPANGPTDLVFDYMVYGLRIGFEDVSIVQEKQREAHIPSMRRQRERYARYPDLKKFSALTRFKNMQTMLGETRTIDLSNGEALRNAIEEFDPAIHGKTDFLGSTRQHMIPGEKSDRFSDIKREQRDNQGN